MITITRNISNAALASALVFALTTGSALAQAPAASKPQTVNLGPMDQNGDGKISSEEAQWVTAKSIAKIDANHDGVITTAELKAEEERLRDADRQRQLSLLDTNHDGKTSTAEFAAMDTDRFKSMDRNHDGFLSPDELRPQGQ
jgi:Ca2+-binding EF-hand superfamily protein